jgi:hypothetical protein
MLCPNAYRARVARPIACATVECGRCRQKRTEAEWTALPAVTQVEGAALAGLVSRWPAHLVVVVRACTCGSAIARLAPRA